MARSLKNIMLENLFVNCVRPKWWVDNGKVTYGLCYVLSESYSEYISNDVEKNIMRKSLAVIDPSIIFPENYRNLKRKILSKKSSLEIVREFYQDNVEEAIIGDKCEVVGLTPKIFDKIINEIYNVSKIEVSVTNEIVLEIFKYINKSKIYVLKDLKKVLCFLSNVDEGSFSQNSLHQSLIKLHQKDNKIRHTGDNKARKPKIAKFINSLFVFPQSILCSEKNPEELYQENLKTERQECDKLIKKYESEIKKLKLKWQNTEEENDVLNDLLFRENILKENSEAKNVELLAKLKVSNKKYKEISDEMNLVMNKLHTFSTREINRKLKRRDEKIQTLTAKTSNINLKYVKLLRDKERMELEVMEQNDKIEELANELFTASEAKRKLQKQKSYYKKRIGKSKLYGNENELLDYETVICELKDEICRLENEKLETEDQLQGFINNELPQLKNTDGSYKNNVRACFQDLVLSGVSIKETKNVIIKVLKNMANITVKAGNLPSTTFARNMYAEARLLAQIQLGTTLISDYEKNNLTLQTDGTSKFGKHFGTYDIANKSGENLVIGLRPMATGDTETQMSVLKEILQEIEVICDGSATNMAKKMIASIKNTMSDRHIVQKKFNMLLQDYRSDVLPDVIKGWENLSECEQVKMKSINSFYCGLHYVVGLADQAESVLKVYDKLLYNDQPRGSVAHGGFSNGESGTLRLIRTLCKAVQERGCEKSGRMVDFALALQADGIDQNPLIQFKGNRFNVIFYDAGIVYFLHKYCQKYFNEVFEENRLLSAVHYDINEHSYVVGCRALGLINKFITGPLWRLFVKVKNIFDLNMYYQRMEKLFSELSQDSTQFLEGKIVFFEGFENGLISKDDVYYKLLEPNKTYDDLTKQLLELLFASFSVVTNRMLYDHLTEGRYNQPSQTLIEECESVPPVNSYPESNFGFLDRLMREKPNANEITFESIIMCRSNRMAEWRDNLSEVERERWMNWAKIRRRDHYKKFLERRKEIRILRNEKRLSKVENKKRKLTKHSQEKEELCKKLEACGGLWKSTEEVHTNLIKFSDGIKIKEALKCQLKFRQKVLCNQINDPSLFLFSKDKIQRSNSDLRKNLELIINHVNQAKDQIPQKEDPKYDLPLDVPIEKLNKEKDRLNLLVIKEKQKHKLKENLLAPPSAKRKKICTKITRVIELPNILSKEELLGKRVAHLTVDEKGNPKWYNGTVLCVKPGTLSEMVIRYDLYSTLYSFDYSEFSDGLVELIQIDPEYAVGKLIMQQFCDDEEVDTWWENGRIISYNPATALYTINYYHADGDLDLPIENDDDFLVYETMSLPLEEDYMKHEIRFF